MRKSILLILSICSAGLILAQSTLTLQPDGTTMKDAMIRSLGNQYGGYTAISMHSWTNGGNDVFHRSLLEFDLTSIPPGSTVSSATLYLYGDPNNPNMANGNSQLSGSNACYLRRITSTWEEDTVLWITMPSTDTTNQATLPASITTYEDYLVDITDVVQDIVNDPSNSFGFMIQNQTESPFRTLVFASSDVSDSTIRPKIVINYDTSTDVIELMSSELSSYVYPNPFDESGILRFDNAAKAQFTVEIINIVGQRVDRIDGVSSDVVSLKRNGLKDGIYFYRLIRKGLVEDTGKFIIR